MRAFACQSLPTFLFHFLILFSSQQRDEVALICSRRPRARARTTVATFEGKNNDAKVALSKEVKTLSTRCAICIWAIDIKSYTSCAKSFVTSQYGVLRARPSKNLKEIEEGKNLKGMEEGDFEIDSNCRLFLPAHLPSRCPVGVFFNFFL